METVTNWTCRKLGEVYDAMCILDYNDCLDSPTLFLAIENELRQRNLLNEFDEADWCEIMEREPE